MPRFPRFNNPGFRHKDFRVALTGFVRSGKTVLITSLINHLLQHDPDRFRLEKNDTTNDTTKDKMRIVNAEVLPHKSEWPPFPYDKYRASLAERPPSWPEKTRSGSSIRLEYDTTRWRFTKARLTLYDLPGERFSDCCMYRTNYKDWSDRQIDLLRYTPDKPRELREFLDYLDSSKVGSDPKEAEIITKYKIALLAMHLRYQQYLSPSTVLIDRDGQLIIENGEKGLSPSEIDPQRLAMFAERRTAGLPDGEFAPLPQSIRERNSKLTAQFEQRYRRYRKSVVAPIFKTLAKCNSLAVLIDITHILAGGPACLNEAEQFVTDVLEAVNPGRKWHHLVRSPLPKPLSGDPITRIAFVATQIDRVHRKDWDHVHMLLNALERVQKVVLVIGP